MGNASAAAIADRDRQRGMPKKREIDFRYPRRASIFCEVAAATVRDSRHATGRSRFEPSEWFDYADRGFSRRVQEFVWCRYSKSRLINCHENRYNVVIADVAMFLT